MTAEFPVRLIEPAEHRAAAALFRATVHSAAPDDNEWERAQLSFQPGRTFGAFDGDEIIGLAKSVDAELTVPGGKQVPVGAVCQVGVRADRTRRGVMTALLTAELTEFAERGLPLAALHASEAVIYGRFGYGVATQERTYRVDRRRAKLRDATAGAEGRVQLHELEDAVRIVPELYAPHADARPGMITRPSYLWGPWEAHYRRSRGLMRLAVYHGPEGPEAYAAYRVHDPWPDPGESTMFIEDMNAKSPAAFRAIWRFLLGVDLVDRIEARARPVDEPVEPMLVDSRVVGTREITDDVWLRLVDVPAALAARVLSGEGSVVVGVRDAVLSSNDGNYRVSAAGVERTTDAAALTMDVEVLAMLYLGGWRAANLVQAGRIEVADAAAVAVADRLFATERVPWCGTFF